MNGIPCNEKSTSQTKLKGKLAGKSCAKIRKTNLTYIKMPMHVNKIQKEKTEYKKVIH